MKRYGYLDMEEGYSDVAGYWAKARCVQCGHLVDAIREDCWLLDGQLVTDCGCAELAEYLAENNRRTN